jgi:hypothetical protein
VVDPEDWPFLPLEAEPLASPPLIGAWAWIIPEKVRHSSFHRVVSVEVIDHVDDEPVTVVEGACGLAWPLEAIAATVSWHDPVLDRQVDGAHARCRNCSSGDVGRHRRSFWSRQLQAARAAGRVSARNLDR